MSSSNVGVDLGIAIAGYLIGGSIGLTKYTVRKRQELDTAITEILELRLKDYFRDQIIELDKRVQKLEDRQ